MRRSIPNSASGDGGDRTTTPGVGEDSRATLPDALPPVRPSRDFKHTIPMGSSHPADWPTRLSTTSQSGVHTMGVRVVVDTPVGPETKSDRAPGQRPTEADAKRLIGSGELGRTLRVMTVPPPAGGAPGGSSFPPPMKPAPITPAPTIRLSPEIAIPTRPEQRVPEMPRTVAPVEPTPTPTTPATTTHAEPLQLSPEAHPAAASSPPVAQIARNKHSGWARARRWVFVFAAVSASALIGAVAFALLFTAPSQPGSAPVAATAEVAPPEPVDLRPATNIVTSPPGAEIVLRGALVANSPARITRPAYESLYLLRLRGYQPQLVALSPHSPNTIHIDLQPLGGVAVTPVPTTPVPATPVPADDDTQ